jgi:UDP-N-acetylmuramoylalanine--D-glutamate ligase
MIQIPSYAGKTVAVLGLAKSGLAAANALAASGASVWAWDDDPLKRAQAEQAGIAMTDLETADWSRPAALVLSPGIPHTFPKPHPVAMTAKERRCPILGDIELLLRACPQAQVVATSRPPWRIGGICRRQAANFRKPDRQDGSNRRRR